MPNVKPSYRPQGSELLAARSRAEEAHEKAKAAHKASGPYKNALEVVQSPTYAKMHSTRRNLQKINRAIRLSAQPPAKAPKMPTSNGYMVGGQAQAPDDAAAAA